MRLKYFVDLKTEKLSDYTYRSDSAVYYDAYTHEYKKIRG